VSTFVTRSGQAPIGNDFSEVLIPAIPHKTQQVNQTPFHPAVILNPNGKPVLSRQPNQETDHGA
jgi:hypothetical protein